MQGESSNGMRFDDLFFFLGFRLVIVCAGGSGYHLARGTILLIIVSCNNNKQQQKHKPPQRQKTAATAPAAAAAAPTPTTETTTTAPQKQSTKFMETTAYKQSNSDSFHNHISISTDIKTLDTIEIMYVLKMSPTPVCSFIARIQ